MSERCPKCDAESGDDWSRCGKSCPLPGSPHFDPSALLRAERKKAEMVVFNLPEILALSRAEADLRTAKANLARAVDWGYAPNEVAAFVGIAAVETRRRNELRSLVGALTAQRAPKG